MSSSLLSAIAFYAFAFFGIGEPPTPSDFDAIVVG
jgi:hypothetical protein